MKEFAVNIDVNGVNKHCSTGYIFNSACNSKTYILTSKHSICLEKPVCEKIEKSKDSCRTCNPNIGLENIDIQLLDKQLKPITAFKSKRTDVALLEVTNTKAAPSLEQNASLSDNFIVWSSFGKRRFLLNQPEEQVDGLIKYNIASNVNANLQAKDAEFGGFSGGLIFKKVGNNFYPTAVLTEDGEGNDIGAEVLDQKLLCEFEMLTGTKTFNRSTEIVSQHFRESSFGKTPSVPGEGALANLMERSQQLSRSDPDYRYMLEELSQFLKPRRGRKIIGLRKKLDEANRQNTFEEARFLSNKFARRVSSGQFSSADEIIFYHCLCFINSVFLQSISPAIKSGVSPLEIDRMVLNEIVKPLNDEVSGFSMSISPLLIMGMLYYLTGKCPIRWT